MQSESSLGVSTGDGNEGCCGACRSGGDLICCEGCPAAFHPECAGYVSAGEVPEGDWLCWFCAKERGKRYQHPTTQYQHPGGLVHILLATDNSAEVFCRVKLLNTSEKYLELTCMDIEAEPEIVPKSSPRLWHGTVNKAAWCIDADGIHWRPNCRTFKVDRLALAALQNKDTQQQQQQEGEEAATTPKSTSCPNAEANGTPGRSKLKLHFKGLKASSPARQQDQQQQGQQAAAAAASGKQRPPAAPGRVSVPPSPQLQPAGDSAGLLSPDSAGGPSPNGAALTSAVANAVEGASRRGVQRIPEGEGGAGLPLVQGGASKAQFDAALAQFWAQRTRVTGERAPSLITIGGTPVDAWVFWRGVWAWGGPEEVHKNKLWATLGHCFNPPSGATSISSRMKEFYAAMLAPLDKAIDAGAVDLERPAASRVPSDRWLQVRAPSPSPGPGAPKRRPSQLNLQAAAASSQPGVNNTSAAPSPTNSLGGGPTVSGSTAAPAPAAAGGGGGVGEEGPAGAVSGGKGGGSGKQRQRQPRQRSKQRPKRRRADQWSDNDEDDVILADDVESSEYSDDAMQSSSDDEVQQQQQRPRQRQQQQQQVPQRGLREANSSAGVGVSGLSKAPAKRLRVSVSKVKEEMVADGLDSAGGYEYLRQPTDLVVLGKVRLTPAARDMQVGDCVDFRLPSSSGSSVTGWRSGIVLAIAPGSEWEGGRRLLVKPRHTNHHSHHHPGTTPSLPPDSPAAAALAAVAAAGGPTGGVAAESAIQKLLTPSGHLRHELAGLLSSRSGSIKLGSAGDTPPPPALAAAGVSSSSQQQRQATGSNESDAANQPQWVPMVWRGDCWQPFLAPPVLVRPHYAPKTTLVAGAGAAGAAVGEGSVKSPFASPQQQEGTVVQHELRLGSYVEVLREGCWCPAQVLEVLPNGGAGGGSCVVLRSMAPPEADGSVWRCSGTHPMRPMHPRYTSGCGVVQCAGPEELITVSAMRKAMAPYMYSEGVHAFACLDHMQAAQRAARAAAQG